MAISARYPITTHYRVEASGWDRHEEFFVEESELEWSEDSGKSIALSYQLHDGAVIFVRLLQPISADRSSPIAYAAVGAGQKADGRYRFRLQAMQPRNNDSEFASARSEKEH